MTKQEQKNYRNQVKQNIEKCIELVGSIKELSKTTGFSVSTIHSWCNCKTDIKYKDLIHVIDTTAKLERERIESINNIEVNL